MIVQCCVCKKVRDQGEWIAPDKTAAPNVNELSHGYCPVCAAKAFDEIRAWLSENKRPARSPAA